MIATCILLWEIKGVEGFKLLKVSLAYLIAASMESLSYAYIYTQIVS